MKTWMGAFALLTILASAAPARANDYTDALEKRRDSLKLDYPGYAHNLFHAQVFNYFSFRFRDFLHVAGEYIFDDVVPGYSVKMLAAGYNLGHVAGTVTVTIPEKEEFVKLVGKESQRCVSEIDGLKAGNDSARNNFVAATSGRQEPGAAAKASSVAAKSARKPDLKRFADCAHAALPLLKTALAAELSGDRTVAERFLVATDTERGDELGASAAGIACGKHLGAGGVPRPTRLIDELKALLALSAVSGEDQKLVFKAMVVVRHVRAPKEARLLWEYYLNRVALAAALGASALPPLEQLKAEYVSSLTITKAGTEAATTLASRDTPVDEAYSVGLAFADKILLDGLW